MLKQCEERPKRKQFKIFMRDILSLVEHLEDTLIKADETDREILMTVGLNRLKYQSINLQLQEAQLENKHLLDMLQLSNIDTNVARCNSFSSCSTMSLVHLQYKYEELSAKYDGLLKILELRLSDIRRSHEENEKLIEEIQALKSKLGNYEKKILCLMKKLKDIRTKKKIKISKLRKERNTLRLVHNKLVTLLNEQCLEIDKAIAGKIKHCSKPDEALLMQEVRKNNLLSYENIQLQQEIEYLQSMLQIKSKKSHDSILLNCRCNLLNANRT